MLNEELTGAKSLEFGIRWARLALLFGLGYLFFATFQPVFSALICSSVLSHGLHSLYCRLGRVIGNQKSLNTGVSMGCWK